MVKQSKRQVRKKETKKEQGTRGPEDQRTRGPADQGTKGLEEQGTRGPKKEKTTQNKYLPISNHIKTIPFLEKHSILKISSQT